MKIKKKSSQVAKNYLKFLQIAAVLLNIQLIREKSIKAYLPSQ